MSILITVINTLYKKGNFALNNQSIGLDPSSGWGLVLLIIGAFFTSGIILIFININEDSEQDKKRKKKESEATAKKIERLYPKRK